MVLKIDVIQQNCRLVARQVHDYARALNLTFIVHHTDQYLEALSLTAQHLLNHRAAESAISLLKKPQKFPVSAFLGLVSWRENIFMGLSSRMNAMALTTLNIDNFKSPKTAKMQAWHMAYHAITLYQSRYSERFEDNFKNGLVVPDFSEEERAAVNLRADIFSALMASLQGDRNAIERLAHARSINALSRRLGHHPELFPFPIAADATILALNELREAPPSRKKQIETAINAAQTIGQAYDDINLKQWIYFCKPAQDMAWRGEEKDIIIGAAVSTSQDTYIRATGFLVSETLNIKPCSVLALQDRYSPFAEEKYNQRLHEAMIERTLQQAIHAGMNDSTGRAFTEAANVQNQKLSDGHILGWCAAALQAAGRAFDAALASGNKTPDQVARREFEFNAQKTTWDTLKDLGESIVEKYRQGQNVSFGDIIEFCGQSPAMANVANSITHTMNDPSYLKKLDVANDLDVVPAMGPRPSAPAPQAAPVMSAPGPRAPGLGGGTPARPPQQTTIRRDDPPDELEIED